MYNGGYKDYPGRMAEKLIINDVMLVDYYTYWEG